MIDERLEELAALYALDLLRDDEKNTFEATLARDAQLWNLVRELREGAADFALTAEASRPSPALRDRILDSISKTPNRSSADDNKLENQPPGKVVSFPSWIPWAAAACFALVAGYTSLRLATVRTDLAAQMQKSEMADLDLRSLQQKFEAERIVTTQQIADLQKATDLATLKIAKLASLNGNSPEAVAIAVWNPLRQEGVLTVASLPLIQKDQDYQLWVIDPRYKNPVSGGVFSVDAKGTAKVSFHPDQPISAATHFAISREKKGGVAKAEGPIVALGAL